jgi:hypothetical protein
MESRKLSLIFFFGGQGTVHVTTKNARYKKVEAGWLLGEKT